MIPNPHYKVPSQPHHLLKDILCAKVYDIAKETPLDLAKGLSNRLGNTILLKREDCQPVFSFKLRGALNCIHRLSPEQRKRGVITCSAGNHAQGVALAAKTLNIRAIVVMPKVTPEIKVNAVRALGAQVVLHGDDFDDANAHSIHLAKELEMTIIPPFDHEHVIAGQGTVAMEILRQCDLDTIDAIFVCVGGGGLAAGIASYVKSLNPRIKVIGVETVDADALTQSLAAGQIVTLDTVGLFADGAAVKTVGTLCFDVCKPLLDGTIRVTTDEICAAIKDVFEDTRSILEPAGALGVAGCKKYAQQVKGSTLVAVCSGANMNFDRLKFVCDRANIGEKKEVLFRVLIPEKPGTFMSLYQCIHPRLVSGFSYRYNHQETARVFLSFFLNKPENREQEVSQLLHNLDAKGFIANDLSQDELAKTHFRYLVGGQDRLKEERFFRFSFPERPNALSRFLELLMNTQREPWNVTLFHYQNLSGDVGKVLVGMQVPLDTSDSFNLFLNQLGYPFIEETNHFLFD